LSKTGRLILNYLGKVILDSSAFIALLDQETGWEAVSMVMNKSAMSSVNVSEVTKYLIDRRKYSMAEAQKIMEQLLDEIIPFTAEHAYIAANFYPDTKTLGLSLGDRACLALVSITGSTVYTADKVWSKINIPKINIVVIR